MIKKYSGKLCTDNCDFEAVIEIDHSILTDEKLHEILNFWSGAKERLEKADNNITVAVLKALCVRIFTLSVQVLDVVAEFDYKAGKGVEGWPAMDGSYGIKIIRYEELTVEDEDIAIEVPS